MFLGGVEWRLPVYRYVERKRPTRLSAFCLDQNNTENMTWICKAFLKPEANLQFMGSQTLK